MSLLPLRLEEMFYKVPKTSWNWTLHTKTSKYLLSNLCSVYYNFIANSYKEEMLKPGIGLIVPSEDNKLT